MNLRPPWSRHDRTEVRKVKSFAGRLDVIKKMVVHLVFRGAQNRPSGGQEMNKDTSGESERCRELTLGGDRLRPLAPPAMRETGNAPRSRCRCALSCWSSTPPR